MLAEFGADVIGDILVEGDLCVLDREILAYLVGTLPRLPLACGARDVNFNESCQCVGLTHQGSPILADRASPFDGTVIAAADQGLPWVVQRS